MSNIRFLVCVVDESGSWSHAMMMKAKTVILLNCLSVVVSVLLVRVLSNTETVAYGMEPKLDSKDSANIVAKEIKIVDGDGKTGAILTSSGIVFFDRKGVIRATLGLVSHPLATDSPGLELYGSNQKPRVMIGATDEDCEIVLIGKNSNPSHGGLGDKSLQLRVQKTGECSLSVATSGGATLSEMKVRPDGSANFGLFGRKGCVSAEDTGIISIGYDDDFRPRIEIKRQNGDIFWQSGHE